MRGQKGNRDAAGSNQNRVLGLTASARATASSISLMRAGFGNAAEISRATPGGNGL
jgi:hypothetical protein